MGQTENIKDHGTDYSDTLGTYITISAYHRHQLKSAFNLFTQPKGVLTYGVEV